MYKKLQFDSMESILWHYWFKFFNSGLDKAINVIIITPIYLSTTVSSSYLCEVSSPNFIHLQ
jgi:hypothetical protein